MRCRFTMQSHENYRKQIRIADEYAQAKIQQDKRPRWERELATGASDEANQW